MRHEWGISECSFILPDNAGIDRPIAGRQWRHENARDGRGGLRRHGYCSSLFAGHSKMGMLVLLNGAIVSHNPGQSPINSMGDTAARADP